MNWIASGILFSLFAVPGTSDALSANCKSHWIRKYLAMDYKTFDQSPPDGGWRILKDKGRDAELAELLDAYRICKRGLTSEQKAVLVFHSGQIYADMGRYDKALERIRRAFDSGLDERYHWNSFVEGTIAFLENDPKNGPKKIEAARDKIAAKESDHPYIQTLTNLLKCFGRPYKGIEACLAATTQPNNPNSAGSAVR